MRTAATLCALLLLFLVSTGSLQFGPVPSTSVSVDIASGVTLQAMDGFGTSLVAGFEAFKRGHFDEVVPVGVTYTLSHEHQREILTTAIRELGVSHARVWLWPLGIEPVNDNDDPQVIAWKAFKWAGQSGRPQAADIVENRQNGIIEVGEILKRAVPLGLQNWILTPGRLPSWLADEFKQSHPSRFEEYAEWAAVHCLFLKKDYGLEPPYWSMFNEPDVAGWRTPDEWIPWLKATGRRFRREGLRTKIVFPDTAGVGDALLLSTGVLKDAEVRDYLGALAYHHYRSSGKGPQPFLKLISAADPDEIARTLEQVTSGPRAMAELGRRWGLPSWQTETAYYPATVKGLTEWEIGMARANEIHLELVSGAAAVQGMMMFWPEAVDPRYGITVRHEGHHIVVRSDGRAAREWEVTKDTGAVFAHWGRFVRPGDQRVAVESTDAAVKTTAFVSKSRSRCAAILINNSVESKHTVVTISSIPSRSAITSFVTDAGSTFRPLPAAPVGGATGTYELTLPARSLTTVVWSAAPVEPPRIAR